MAILAIISTSMCRGNANSSAFPYGDFCQILYPPGCRCTRILYRAGSYTARLCSCPRPLNEGTIRRRLRRGFPAIP